MLTGTTVLLNVAHRTSHMQSGDDTLRSEVGPEVRWGRAIPSDVQEE
jgi:hypothetical protein